MDNPAESSAKTALRGSLRAARLAFTQGPLASAAQAQLGRQLDDILAQVEAECVGLYWPLQGEWDAVAWAKASPGGWTLALPHADKASKTMGYRRWDGEPPETTDGCGIPTASGAWCEPDVILAPCLGFNPHGYRLGYGGGYFDRYMAAHPGTLVIGVAWRVTLADFPVEAHDQAPALILTEEGVWQP